MQNMNANYLVTYPVGKVSRDELLLYDRLDIQNSIQSTMNGGGGGGGRRRSGDSDNLSNLSDAERRLVLDVLRRDEQLREQDFTRIEILRSEVEALERRLAANESGNGGGGRDGSSRRRCSLCSVSFGWIFSRGDTCRRCLKTRVCGNCRQTTTTTTNEGWICLLCYKKQQLYLKSGSWFNRTFSGRRRLRRLTESETPALTYRNNNVNRKTSSSKSFDSVTLPPTNNLQAPPMPETLATRGVDVSRSLSTDQTDICAYPDENDRELLKLLSGNMYKKHQQALNTDDVGLLPSQPQDSADAVARRRADAEVFRRGGHRVAKRCFSEEFPEWLQNHEIQELRSYRTVEDLSSSFREDGSDSTNSTRIGEETSDVEPEPCNDGSNTSAAKISEQFILQNETGDYIRKTSSMEQEERCRCRDYPGTDTSDETLVSKEFQNTDLTSRERKSPGTERKSSSTEQRSYSSERRSHFAERKSPATGRRTHVTNDSGSYNSSSWSGEDSLDFSPSVTREEVMFQTSGGWRSDSEESDLPVRAEDPSSETSEIDLALLTWKAEIEQLFQEPRLLYEQNWDEEVDSLGVLRDVIVWSGSRDGEGEDAGTDLFPGDSFSSLPPIKQVSGFVVDTAEPILVEVGEEEKMMSLQSQQPKRYLRIFNDEDSLSVISERTEPPGSDQASVDLDRPSSETGWQSDAFATSDEETLGVSPTDTGIDRAIDRIVSLEVELSRTPCDLDAEIDRLVTANREHLSRNPDTSNLNDEQLDKLNEFYIHGSHRPRSLFHLEQEENGNQTNASDNYCGFQPIIKFSRSPDYILPLENNLQISGSENPKPTVPLISRHGDATTSNRVTKNGLTSVDHNSSQLIQPLSDNSVYSSHDVGERENQILNSLGNGAGSTEVDYTRAGRTRTSSVAKESNGELLSDAFDSSDVDKLDSVSSVETWKLENEAFCGSPRDDSHSQVNWRNFNGDESQNDAGDLIVLQ